MDELLVRIENSYYRIEIKAYNGMIDYNKFSIASEVYNIDTGSIIKYRWMEKPAYMDETMIEWAKSFSLVDIQILKNYKKKYKD